MGDNTIHWITSSLLVKSELTMMMSTKAHETIGQCRTHGQIRSWVNTLQLLWRLHCWFVHCTSSFWQSERPAAGPTGPQNTWSAWACTCPYSWDWITTCTHARWEDNHLKHGTRSSWQDSLVLALGWGLEALWLLHLNATHTLHIMTRDKRPQGPLPCPYQGSSITSVE